MVKTETRITPDDAIELIEDLITELGTRSKAADALGISPQYLSDIMSGARAISDNVARKLGYSKVVYYEKQDWEVND